MPHLEHIGIAIDDLKAAAHLYETLLALFPYKREQVEREGVQTHFFAAGTVKLELLEALGPDSPVAKYLKKRGPGLHHLAFEVEDIHAQMQHARALGFLPLSDEPRPGADGKLIFFLHPKQTHGVLIECCQSTPAPLPAVRVPYRDGYLAAYEAGAPDRSTVAVLHGAGGATMLETEPLVRKLEQHFHILALDFAGHGASAPFTEEPFSADFFADNLRAVLDHFGVEQAHLFGFSMGGFVALRFASLHPGRVQRLAVHATNADWDDALKQALQARLDPRRLTRLAPAFAERLDAIHQDWKALLERTRAFIDTFQPLDAVRDELAAVRHLVLVSGTDRDELFPLRCSLILHGALPNSSLALLPGARHMLDALDLQVFASLLMKHFEST